MSFAAFSPTVFWLALLGSALALYALHRLKSRPKSVRVPTLQFWKSVAKPSRARRFFGPFRHPRTYAFSLLFLASLLLALADPSFEGEAKPVLLVCDWTPSLEAQSGESTRLLALADSLLDRLDAEGPNARVAIARLSAFGLSYLGTAETPRPTLRKTLLELREVASRANAAGPFGAAAGSLASSAPKQSTALDFASQPPLLSADVQAMAGLLRARAKDSGASLELLTDRPEAWQPQLPEARLLTLGGVVSDLAWRGARQVGEALEVLFEREGNLPAKLLLAVDGAAPLELPVLATSGRFVQRFELPAGATALQAELRGPSGRLGPPLQMRLAREPEAVFLLDAEAKAPEAQLLARVFSESGLFRLREGDDGIGAASAGSFGSKGSTRSRGLVRLELSEGVPVPAGASADPLRYSLEGLAALLGEERGEPLPRWPLPSEAVRPLAPRDGEIPLLLDAQGAPLVLYASGGASRGKGAGTAAPAEPGAPNPAATATATLRLSRDLLALGCGLVKDPAGLAAFESLLRIVAGARASDTAWPAEAQIADTDLAARRLDLPLDPRATRLAHGDSEGAAEGDRSAVASAQARAALAWTSPDSPGVALSAKGLAGTSHQETGPPVARSSDSPLRPPLESEKAPFRWFEGLIAFALGLALIEAFLFGRRRIP